MDTRYPHRRSEGTSHRHNKATRYLEQFMEERNMANCKHDYQKTAEWTKGIITYQRYTCSKCGDTYVVQFG